LAGQDSRGLLDADQAVALSPNLAGVIETRAEIHEKLGQREKAIADYRQALSLDWGPLESLQPPRALAWSSLENA
jgi:Tfp pilus assembly protein PilF